MDRFSERMADTIPHTSSITLLLLRIWKLSWFRFLSSLIVKCFSFTIFKPYKDFTKIGEDSAAWKLLGFLIVVRLVVLSCRPDLWLQPWLVMGMDREDKSDRCTVQGISYEGTDTVAASLTWASWRHPIKLGCRRWWVCSWSGPCHWQFTKCAYPLSWTHWGCTKAALITYRWWLPLTWWQPFGTRVPGARYKVFLNQVGFTPSLNFSPILANRTTWKDSSVEMSKRWWVFGCT